MLAVLILLSASFFCVNANGSGPDAKVKNRPYNYLSYEGTMTYFENLKRDYPDLVETWIAQDIFPEMLPEGTKKSWASCGSLPCQTLIVRIANKHQLEDQAEAEKRPEVFFSGALHGDERLGPLVVTELAGFLCSQYREGNLEVKRLVDTRNTWIMPMTNAFGYAHNTRTEQGMDPNRDFPYLQQPSRCMLTQTGRAVNELFRRHLFQFTLTFHGGMRALTYEWGSRNHLRSGKSTESPDDAAFTEVGRAIRAASGKDGASRSWYPLGRINDLVYPVDGGMEDWSYGAGFESPKSTITECRPKTYGGYKASRTQYRSGSLSTLVYLAEMDDRKTPRSSTLGSTSEVWGMGPGQGHVARNLRMCLKLIELAKPELLFEPVSWPSSLRVGQELSVNFRGMGCFSLSSARLLLLPLSDVGNCSTLAGLRSSPSAQDEALARALQLATLQRPASCEGLSIWTSASGASSNTATLRGALPAVQSPGPHCAVVAAEFDQGWGQQHHPDPGVRPQSHAARLRLEDRYEMAATDALQGDDGPRMRLQERKTKLFPVLSTPLHLGEAGTPPSPLLNSATPADSASPASPVSPVSSATGEALAAHPTQPSTPGTQEQSAPSQEPAAATSAPAEAAPAPAAAGGLGLQGTLQLEVLAVLGPLVLCAGLCAVAVLRRKGHLLATVVMKGEPQEVAVEEGEVEHIAAAE